MVHRESELKRRNSINPYPNCSDFTQYHDVVRQNEWLRALLQFIKRVCILVLGLLRLSYRKVGMEERLCVCESVWMC